MLSSAGGWQGHVCIRRVFWVLFDIMWPFQKKKPTPLPSLTTPSVLDLQERMERLERDMRDMKTDWNTTYDKFHALTMRMRKRAKLEEKEAEDPPEPTNGPQPISNPLAELLLRRGRIR